MVRIVCLLCSIVAFFTSLPVAARRSSVPARHGGAANTPPVCRSHGWHGPTNDLMVKFGSNPTMSSGTLDLRASTSTLSNLEISNNDFSGVDWGGADAAIYLHNSEGFILGNTITGREDGTGYVFGIRNEGDPNWHLGEWRSASLICSNDISIVGKQNVNTTSPGGGISTSKYVGYSKLNTVYGCDRGHVNGIDDRGHIVFSSYSSNLLSAIDGIASTAEIDLSGVHSSQANDDDFGAFNNFLSNGTAAIQLSSGAIVYLGRELEASWSWSEWCKNNFKYDFEYDSPTFLTSDQTTDISEISQNYFAGLHHSEAGLYWVELDPYDGLQVSATDRCWSGNGSCGSNSSNSHEIQYSAVQDDIGHQPFEISGVICGVGISNPRGKGSSPQSKLDKDSCTLLRNIGYGLVQDHYYRQGYDTLRRYVETCPNQSGSWRAFDRIGEAFSYLSAHDSSMFLSYREWLLSVLYLNTTEPLYYCADVEQIMSTFSYNGPTRGYDINAGLAITRFIADSTNCQLTPDSLWWVGYNNLRRDQYHHWQDTVNPVDSMTHKLDTTLPSMAELGLSKILQRPQAVAPTHKFNSSFALRIVESSGRKEIDAVLNVPEISNVKIELLDILGRVAQSIPIRLFNPGANPISLKSDDLPNGTYFVRASALNGDVITARVNIMK
jgi:hypothetical protein